MSRRLRSVGGLAVVALMALFMLVPIAGAAPRAAETKNVTVKDFAFDPKTISINIGDTITWTNEGPAPHTVSADEADSFESGNMDKGATFSETFDEAGTFAYYCKYHGSKGGAGMAGTVVVAEAAAPAAAPAMAEPSGTVDAADQAIVDSSITVANVTAGQDGWIVAHLDEGGKPGKVIGNTAVKKGENKDVKIQLSEAVAAGGKLWPMLHIDAGAIGTYEFPGPDTPVIVGGNIVMKQIAVTAPAAAAPAPAAAADAVDVSDQPVTNSSITVANVTASVDGWIVAHLDEGGKPGKVIGNTAVKKGDNKNVAIKLSEAVAVGGKLWPMLHIDAGAIGTYEFPGPDAPVIVDGNIIMKQITVTAAGAAAPAAPAQLPTTGGEDAPLSVLLAAFGLLLGGAWLTSRLHRRA
jgi:LPXTG-motif cell wall-anchored protein